MDGLAIIRLQHLKRQRSRERERGTKRAAKPVLSALCASVPLRLSKHFHQIRLQSLERKDDAAEGQAHAC